MDQNQFLTTDPLTQPMLGVFENDAEDYNRKVFRLSADRLTMFFDKNRYQQPDNEGESRVALQILKTVGYVPGMCTLIDTNARTGIIGDQADLARRRRYFGKHFVAMPQLESFWWTKLPRQYEDPNVIYLIWGASLYLGFSVFSNGNSAYVEALMIYFGIFFASFIQAICEYQKDAQWLSLKSEINNQEVIVYRGNGDPRYVKVKDVVVGDLIQVTAGNRVPADCILVEEMNMEVDQSMIMPNLPNPTKVQKSLSRQSEDGSSDNHCSKINPDPFLFAESKVLQGSGKAIVCAVGLKTKMSRSKKQGVFNTVEGKLTELETKLQKISRWIEDAALIIIAVSFLTQALFVVCMGLFGEGGLVSNTTLLRLTKMAVVSIVLLIVVVPEGLTLAVQMAMSLSISRLKQDNILVKNHESIQKAAIVTDICVSKTGVLTSALLSVSKFFMGICVDGANDNAQDSDTNWQRKQSEGEESELVQSIRRAILLNNDVSMQAEDPREGGHFENIDGVERIVNYSYEPKGNSIEVGMVKMLDVNPESDISQQLGEMKNKYPLQMIQPFDQALKTMITIHMDTENEQILITMKGAPENVLKACVMGYDQNGEEVEMGEDDPEGQELSVRQQELANISDLAKNKLKVISYAQATMSLDEFNESKAEFAEEIEADEYTTKKIRDTAGWTYLGTFGLQDEISASSVFAPIMQLRFGQDTPVDKMPKEEKKKYVKIRLITGDHRDTAESVAREAGVITESDPIEQFTVMSGEDLLTQVQQHGVDYDDETKQITITDKEALKKFMRTIANQLRILYRCTPTHKDLLVRSLQVSGAHVAMVGESIADADALKAADVGISMRSGCDVTKDKSDLVLLKNDFEQIRIAVMWGRLLYKNVERFLTFQLTVNISITVVTIIGGIIGHPPLNVIQMLWVNLIMDILAAISLSTEAWSDNGNTVLAQRAQRTEELLKPTMWRTILVQAVYQVTVMIVLMFFGGLMMGFDQAPNIIYDKLRDPKTKLGTDRLIMDTFIFHVFVLMNLFNSINVRASNPDDLNIFSGITNALWFVLVLALEFFIQQTMINYGSQELTIAAVLFGTGQLSTTMNIVAYVLGFLSIPIGIASKKIDESKFEFTKKWTLTQEPVARKIAREQWQSMVPQVLASKQQDGDAYTQLQDDSVDMPPADTEAEQKLDDEENNDFQN